MAMPRVSIAYAEQHPDEVRLAKLFPVNGEDIATGFVLRSPFFFGLDATLGALVGDEALPRENAGPQPDAPDVTPVGPNGDENGSNAFVVAPRRSADGFTRLVSNSHQPWRGGVAWYELVVHSEAGWNFAGATFPGAPYPLLGHNLTLGWTNTVNRPDLIDVYKLVLNDDGASYRFDGAMAAARKAHASGCHVKLWGPFVLPVPKTVYRAVQGPVIVNKSGAFAIRYGGADQLKMVEEYYRLNRARDFAEWQKALAIQGVPATNFLYGDAKGNIAYFYNASFPNRKPGFDYAQGPARRYVARFCPRHGAVGDGAAQREPGIGLPDQRQQHALSGGRYRLRDHAADYSPLLGIETDTTNRGTRALELMGADPSISDEDLYRIKFDTGVSQRELGGEMVRRSRRGRSRGQRRCSPMRSAARQWDWNFDGKGPADALAAIAAARGQHLALSAPAGS